MFKSDYPLFLLIIIGVIAFNLQYTMKYVTSPGRIFLGSNSYPGKAFLPLRDHLKDVRLAGFYTDRSVPNKDIDVSFAYLFQRAQFALAPTLLDYHRPWEYPYTVAYLHDPERSLVLLEDLGDVVARIDKNVVLLRRKNI